MERSAYFDNSKAILIFLVIVGHMLTKYIHNDHLMASLYLFIYSFHMPSFILVSGYFAKKIYQPGYILKLVKKLLIPYAFFQIVYSIYYIYFFKDPITFSFFVPRWALWFLISLLFWNILLYFFGKIKYGIPLAIFMSIMIGYDASVGEFLSLSRTFFFFPFFLMGYYLQKKHFEQLKKPFHVLLGTLLAIGGFIIIYLYVPIEQHVWLLGKRPYEEMSTLPMEYAWFGRLCSYLIMAVATYMFLTLVPKKQVFFTSIGKVTLTVYLLHMSLVRIFYDSNVRKYIAETDNYWMIFAIAFFIIFILSRKPVITFVNKIRIGK